MKTLSQTLIMAAAIVVLGTFAARASQLATVKANIPFDFVVADQKVPAGEYWFEQREGAFGLRVYSKSLKSPIVLPCHPRTVDLQTPGQLVFHRYGSQHFLKTIESGVVHFGVVVPPSRAEREWRRYGTAMVLRVALP